MILHNFVVFEGGDGSGTSTQLSLLGKHLSLSKDTPPYSIGFEPTDGQIGKLLRQGLSGQIRLKPETIAYLFAADRHEHLYEPKGIVEKAAAGELVVSDRYVPSSLVYQGLSCGETLPARLNQDFPKPELILFFDIDPQAALARISNRETKDEFEKLEFQLLVRERYKRILPEYSGTDTRLVIIDAALPIEEVANLVWTEVQKLPIFKK